jgi:cell division septation protein DedD
VQVNAFPDERSAQRLADRLKQKGYEAYVVTASIKGRDWYRVRIGHFPARAQAKEYLEQLQAKEDFPKAIAVSK